MKRLTFIDNDGWYTNDGDERVRGSFVDRLAEFEDAGLEPGMIKDNISEMVEWRSLGPIEAVEELVKARDEGRLVEQNCHPLKT